MRYKIDYLAYPDAMADEAAFEKPLHQGSFSVPFFWLAHLIAAVMKNRWEQGGKVTDMRTGATRITWELSGNVFSDGKAHLVVDGIDKGPETSNRATTFHAVAAILNAAPNARHPEPQ